MDFLSCNDIPYRVLALLGKGKGGYSYHVSREGKEYVLKQIHHEPCDYYQFGDKLAAEIRDYATLHALGLPMPALLDVDQKEERILKEYIPGPTAKDLADAGAMTPELIAQVEAMCRLLYPAGLNIDYYPTNFIPWNGTLYYIDYECNPYDSKWDFETWGKQYWKNPQEKE